MATDKTEEKDYKIAYSFTAKLIKNFKSIIKAVVLFGSVAKNKASKKSDIDVMVLVDDASVKWDAEVIAWYREEVAKIVRAEGWASQLHINTVTLSSFWDNIMRGEPAAINVLRYGIQVYDTGFFEPLKYLLYEGKIKSSPEAIYTAMGRVPAHLFRAKVRILSAIGDLYWAMVDSAHAPLMQAGETPPSPEHIPDLLKKAFVSKKKLEPEFVEWYQELYRLAHQIKNNEIPEVSGRTYDIFAKRANEFAVAMQKLLREKKRQ